MTKEEISQKLDNKHKATTERREQVRGERAERMADNEGKVKNRRLQVIKEALTIQNFDLEEFYDLIDKIGVGGFDKKYKREWAFAHWCLSDPENRTPEDLEGVAKVLNTSTSTLQDFQRGDRLERFLRQARENMVIQKGEPAYLAWIIDGVESGDKDAIKEFVKLREKRLEKAQPDEKDMIPTEVMQEASKINEAMGEKMDKTVIDAVSWGESVDN
jgi:hypothetical protein